MQDETPAHADHDPYEDFTVDEERMPDGRTIRYYEWPADLDAEPEAASERDV